MLFFRREVQNKMEPYTLAFVSPIEELLSAQHGQLHQDEFPIVKKTRNKFDVLDRRRLWCYTTTTK